MNYRRKQFHAFLYEFRRGRENGYPLCCIVHFSLDMIRGKRGMAIRRGVVYRGTPKVYVPCHFHKGNHPHWEPVKQSETELA